MKRILTAILTTIVVFFLWGGARADVALKPVGRSAVPLRTKTLSADVVIEAGRFASTRLDVTFQNLENQRIEADFIYTVPQGAVVTDFAYYYGDERVVARVTEKARARAIYQHITSRMRDPALVEMIGKNTFRARIFPIMPHADLRVQMRYVQCLPTRGAVASYQLPLLSFGDTPLDKIQVAVHLPGAAKSGLQVQSNFGVPVVRDADGDARVGFTGTNYRPGKDVRVSIAPPPIRVTTTTPPGVSLVAARSGGAGGFFAVAVDGTRPVAKATISLRPASGLTVSELEPLAVPGGYLLTGRYRGTGDASVTVTDGATGKTLPLTHVTFTDRVNAESVASRLWASARIARLSQVKTNSAKVVALSMRWGLPSKFTSWLAIPDEERKRYHREKTEADLTVLAARLGRYIRAGSGSSSAANAIRKQFSSLARSIGESPEQSLRSRLSSVVQTQIYETAQIVAQDVVARRNGPKARAARGRLDRLCRESNQTMQEAMQQALGDPLTQAAARYAPYVERNDSRSRGARQARMELHRLSRIAGTEPRLYLAGPLSGPTTASAKVVAEEIRKDANISPREAKARAELERLCCVTGETPKSFLQNALYQQWGLLTQRYITTVEEGQENGEAGQAVRDGIKAIIRHIPGEVRYDTWMQSVKASAAAQAFRRMEEWARAKNGSTHYFSYASPDTRVEEHWLQNGDPVKPPKPLRVQQELSQKAHRLAVFAGEDPNLLQEKALMPWAAHTVGMLRQQIAAAKGNESEQLRLGNLFLEAVRDPSYGVWADYAMRSYGKNTVAGRVAFASDRIAGIRANPDVDEVDALLEEKASKLDLADHAARRAQRYAEDSRLRVRHGDPLLHVDAPQNSRSVVAILPGGEIKSLVWRADLKRWECRFDVPTYAASGAYEVVVYITATDGSRSQKVFRYDVDTTAPRGQAEVVVASGYWEITVRADEDAARVVAVLPWGDRVVLEAVPGQPGQFFVRVPIPTGTEVLATSVPVYLTDRAHNRTEIAAQLPSQEAGQ